MRMVRAAGLTVPIVALAAIYCVYCGLARYDLMPSFVGRPFIGAIFLVEVSFISLLGAKFSRKTPRAARFAGRILSWLGITLGAFAAGVTAFLAHLNASASVVSLGAILAVVYFMAGLGVWHWSIYGGSQLVPR